MVDGYKADVDTVSKIIDLNPRKTSPDVVADAIAW